MSEKLEDSKLVKELKECQTFNEADEYLYHNVPKSMMYICGPVEEKDKKLVSSQKDYSIYQIAEMLLGIQRKGRDVTQVYGTPELLKQLLGCCGGHDNDEKKGCGSCGNH